MAARERAADSGRPILEAPGPEAGREIPPEAHGEEGPSPQRRDRPIIPSMTQPPAPRTNPGLPNKFVVRSQISGNRSINVLAGLILFILTVMTLFFIVFLLSYDSYSRGYPSGAPSSLFLIALFAILLTPICIYYKHLVNKEQRKCTVVDGSGLLLEQPGMRARFIPWQDAHGHIAVKTVSQYISGTSTPAMMSLILVALDQEQVVLPGSVLNSQPNSSRDIAQQSYATAMQILAYDPWGQSEPLMQSENNFTPYAPRNMYALHNMYMFQNIMRS